MVNASIATAGQAEPTAAFHRLERFYVEMSERNLDAAMTLYDADAEVILPGQAPVHGVRAIRQWWDEMLRVYDFRVTPFLIEATDVGDAVILRGYAKGQLVPRNGGNGVAIDTWFMQVYRKRSNGEYLFWRGASGPNPPN